jgi:hypothetical protein
LEYNRFVFSILSLKNRFKPVFASGLFSFCNGYRHVTDCTVTVCSIEPRLDARARAQELASLPLAGGLKYTSSIESILQA